ncbi:hypothetical protein [Methylocystis echinoides]|uniref:Uncharacterized protein n=1 Tax=Methylocystis echinoides TaxID=29468 RepID=A0A9W6GR64_9HYPH|nr:hypothetical protein [Methylocystis echinoides]GLI91413.1 hypothetical protein LMG27198_04050 [Methylocystis echinoides]
MFNNRLPTVQNTPVTINAPGTQGSDESNVGSAQRLPENHTVQIGGGGFHLGVGQFFNTEAQRHFDERLTNNPSAPGGGLAPAQHSAPILPIAQKSRGGLSIAEHVSPQNVGREPGLQDKQPPVPAHCATTNRPSAFGGPRQQHTQPAPPPPAPLSNNDPFPNPQPAGPPPGLNTLSGENPPNIFPQGPAQTPGQINVFGPTNFKITINNFPENAVHAASSGVEPATPLHADNGTRIVKVWDLPTQWSVTGASSQNLRKPDFDPSGQPSKKPRLSSLPGGGSHVEASRPGLQDRHNPNTSTGYPFSLSNTTPRGEGGASFALQGKGISSQPNNNTGGKAGPRAPAPPQFIQFGFGQEMILLHDFPQDPSKIRGFYKLSPEAQAVVITKAPLIRENLEGQKDGPVVTAAQSEAMGFFAKAHISDKRIGKAFGVTQRTVWNYVRKPAALAKRNNDQRNNIADGRPTKAAPTTKGAGNVTDDVRIPEYPRDAEKLPELESALADQPEALAYAKRIINCPKGKTLQYSGQFSAMEIAAITALSKSGIRTAAEIAAILGVDKTTITNLI